MSSKKRRCLRTSGVSSDSEDEQPDEIAVEQPKDSVVVAEAIRELQKLRKRPAGISLTALATGKEVPEINIAIANDSLKLKTGGIVDMHGLSDLKNGQDEDDVEARLAKTFATETNKRDEDAEMIKYIEEELAKRKGLVKSDSPEQKEQSDLLRDVPEYLRPAIGQQSEDMLSNQMLCGIPEVDLGVEAKMKNIEATEEAKQILLKHRINGRHGPTNDLAPTNVAVNFVQHSRWNNQSICIDYADLTSKRQIANLCNGQEHPKSESTAATGTNVLNNNSAPTKMDVRRLDVERQRLQSEKSTDSIVLQRFKNYMRDRRRR